MSELIANIKTGMTTLVDITQSTTKSMITK